MYSKSTIRILIASALNSSCMALSNAISSDPRFEVIGCVAPDALPADFPDPDVLLVELDAHRRDILHLVESLRHKITGRRVVLLMRHPDDIALRMFIVFASGYVLKTANTNTLFEALYAVHNGHHYIDSSLSDVVMAVLASADTAGRNVNLTPRESQVLAMIAAGQTYKEIAASLNVSVKTVESYRTRIGEKLQLHTRKTLAAYARSHGIVH